MALLEEIRSGARGLGLTLPASFAVIENTADKAVVGDRAAGFAWMLFASEYRLSLDPADDALLRRDVEHHARGIFDGYSLAHRLSRTPRTADPAWSPVIDCVRVPVNGAEALVVVHRLAYSPGKEQLMGHLLVPVAEGTIEIRCIPASSGPTGARESALALAGAGGPPALLSQAEIDDPRHDAQFPSHPLSVARRALRWLTSESDLRVTHPAPFAARDITLSDARYAATLPPRFVELPGTPSASQVQARASRLSLSASPDGVQLLALSRLDVGSAPLERVARDLAPRLVRAPGGARIDVQTNGPAHAQSVAEFVDPSGMSARQVAAWAQSESVVWVGTLTTPSAVPADEALEDVTAALASVRLA